MQILSNHLPRDIQTIVLGYYGQEYDPHCVLHSFPHTTYGYAVFYVTDEHNKTWLLFPSNKDLFCLETHRFMKCEMNNGEYYNQLGSGKLYTTEYYDRTSTIVYWHLVGTKLQPFHPITLPYSRVTHFTSPYLPKDDYIVLRVQLDESSYNVLICHPNLPFGSFTIASNVNCDYVEVGDDYAMLYSDDFNSWSFNVKCIDRAPVTCLMKVDKSLLIGDIFCFIYEETLNLFDMKSRRLILEQPTDMKYITVYGEYLHLSNGSDSEIWDPKQPKRLLRTSQISYLNQSVGHGRIILNDTNAFFLLC